MLKLIIDNIEVEVPKGTKVIDAAEQLGIMIPRFCYHPALGSVGACRVCAVKVIQGPVKGIQMSCMLEAQDAMIISSTDKEVVDFRKHVIELLMLNHPHDCPVCDEGGQCLLQDMTISGGHGLRRFKGNKRTHKDQYLGPLVQHEMNRCIQCYRCSRYYREYTGYNDLGVMGIGSRVYFGRQKSGTIESPFSGNLIDLCPTGVYTDKPSRFKGRRWDFNRTPSICMNCSLGCNIVVSTRYREVVKQEPRYNKAINGYFICDRGRYGFYYANDKKRPRHALIDKMTNVSIDKRKNKEKVPLQNAIEQAAKKLDKITQKNGSGSIACIGSCRNTLETQAVLKELSIKKGWRKPVYHTDPEIDKKVRTAASRLNPELSISLKDLEKADFILAIGADPANEAPMLALSMRQAQKAGAKIAVIDPRPISLPFEFKHLPITLSNMESCLGVLIKETIDYDIAITMGKDFLE
ncbi:NADH-quinone oxidoreductase subunit NuoG, partial [Desulfobacterales bacterium HSG17]|nr:NADH-quinone oxidoreductase subunit NuoG [Desulfobacterales bacterium HSG17]